MGGDLSVIHNILCKFSAKMEDCQVQLSNHCVLDNVFFGKIISPIVTRRLCACAGRRRQSARGDYRAISDGLLLHHEPSLGMFDPSTLSS